MDTRARQANIFASQIISAVRDLLPENGDLKLHIHDHLRKIAYETNALIVNVNTRT